MYKPHLGVPNEIDDIVRQKLPPSGQVPLCPSTSLSTSHSQTCHIATNKQPNYSTSRLIAVSIDSLSSQNESRQHRLRSWCADCRWRHHGLRANGLRSLHRRRVHRRPALWPGWLSTPEPTALRRRAGSGRFSRPGRLLHPTRPPQWQACPEHPQFDLPLWLVHVWQRLEEDFLEQSRKKDLKQVALSFRRVGSVVE